MKKILSLILLIGGLLIANLSINFANATTIVGTAGAGDECNVHAADASHTCAPGLVCIPQNDNSEGNGKCGSDVTPTPTATPTPTPGPEQHYSCNVDHACVLVEGAGDNSCSSNIDCQPEVSPTPTPTNTPSNPGGPGDGRSDGGSSCPSCTQAHNAPIQAVLGLSTTSGEDFALPLVQLFFALSSAGLGFKFFKKS